MASIEQPKKAPTGYWLYLGEKREEIVKTLGTAKGSDVSKKGGEMWKALGEAERKPYEDKAKELKAKYEEDLKAFKEDGGVVTRKSKKNKEEKTKKDPNAPKKPAGGAYGCYLAENREEITASCPIVDGKKPFTAVTKAAGERWKALPEDEKAKYEAMYLKKKEEYQKAMEDYVPPEQPAASPSPPKKATKKRSAEDSGEKEKKAPAAKKPRASTKGSSKDVSDEINPEVLAEARKLGYETTLKNLASRVEIAALSLPADKLLTALKDSEGLVNPAKRALLGGA